MNAVNWVHFCFPFKSIQIIIGKNSQFLWHYCENLLFYLNGDFVICFSTFTFNKWGHAITFFCCKIWFIYLLSIVTVHLVFMIGHVSLGRHSIFIAFFFEKWLHIVRLFHRKLESECTKWTWSTFFLKCLEF